MWLELARSRFLLASIGEDYHARVLVLLSDTAHFVGGELRALRWHAFGHERVSHLMVWRTQSMTNTKTPKASTIVPLVFLQGTSREDNQATARRTDWDRRCTRRHRELEKVESMWLVSGAVVMEKWGFCMMYGSMEAQFEVQPIKRAERTAFLCFLKKVVGLIQVHVGNKGIMDVSWKGARTCIDPKTGDADLWNLGRVAVVNGQRGVRGSGACQAYEEG